MAIKMMEFVVASSAGAWGRGATLKDAQTQMRCNLGGGTREARARNAKMPCTVFASDQPMRVEADVMCRVFAAPGATLVEFGV